MKTRLSLIGVVLCCVYLASCSGDAGDFAAGTASGGRSKPGAKERPPAPGESPPSTPPAEPQPAPPAPSPEPPAQTGLEAEEHRAADARTIVGLLERGYAPREWKEGLFDFSFEERSQEFIDRAGQEMSDAEFYQAIAEYLSGFHDSHVSFNFPSTLVAVLPFDVEEVGGQFLVSRVYPDEMPNGTTIAVGDELLSIDGEAPETIREQLLRITGKGNPLTEMRYATEALTAREQARSPEVPRGESVVGIRSRAEGREREIGLKWKTKGEPFAEMRNAIRSTSWAMSVEDNGHWRPMNLLDEARQKEVDHGLTGERLSVNRPETFFPLPPSYGERKKGPYPTGVMEVGGHRIGFIRIHTYSSRRIDFEKAIEELEEEIASFEQSTEALIIDQTSNGGGNWCHTLNVASFFFDTPQRETRDRWRVNRETVVSMEEISLDKGVSDADRQIAIKIAREVREAMKAGATLTEPIPECNLDGFVKPHTNKDGARITYTKPVLMLVNELSVSCGDYFPAFFQDRGRAVIFGATTSGGGGSVKRIEQRIGYSEILMGYTISMGVREPTGPDAGTGIHYIENAGVTPDIEYAITAEDIVTGYKPYAEAVERAVLALVE